MLALSLLRLIESLNDPFDLGNAINLKPLAIDRVDDFVHPIIEDLDVSLDLLLA